MQNNQITVVTVTINSDSTICSITYNERWDITDGKDHHGIPLNLETTAIKS